MVLLFLGRLRFKNKKVCWKIYNIWYIKVLHIFLKYVFLKSGTTGKCVVSRWKVDPFQPLCTQNNSEKYKVNEENENLKRNQDLWVSEWLTELHCNSCLFVSLCWCEWVFYDYVCKGKFRNKNRFFPFFILVR